MSVSREFSDRMNNPQSLKLCERPKAKQCVAADANAWLDVASPASGAAAPARDAMAQQ